MNKRVIILTGNELRHQYFCKKIALYKGINVLKTYCETESSPLSTLKNTPVPDDLIKHLAARLQSEKDFFEPFVQQAQDRSNAEVIERGSINNNYYYNQIKALQPDLIIVYGASIIKQPLLSAFEGRMLNVHLGLSPYYRGSATNFWPLVDGLPECVGATFMYIDAGIDTGEIIHQIRPVINYYDTPAAIGNRLIKQMTDTFFNIITQFDALQSTAMHQPETVRRYCKKKDYTQAAVQKLYTNFYNGMIDTYLEDKATRNECFPLVVNPLFYYDQSYHVSLCKEV